MTEIENGRSHSLGQRAFLLFLSRRIKFVIFLFVVTGAVWYAERWVPDYDLIWSDYAVKLLLLISIAYFVLVLVHTYLEYKYYTYSFTDEAFMMTSGYMVRSEVAALYHQIQNVNVVRGPMDRLTGVSQIVIFMTGAEKDSTHNRIVLPAVGKKKAKLVQKELLVRARRHVPAGGV